MQHFAQCEDCCPQVIPMREVDDRYLLLVASSGAFVKRSFTTGKYTPVPIPVSSAGTGTDVEN